jgi:hypothetical protein
MENLNNRITLSLATVGIHEYSNPNPIISHILSNYQYTGIIRDWYFSIDYDQILNDKVLNIHYSAVGPCGSNDLKIPLTKEYLVTYYVMNI